MFCLLLLLPFASFAQTGFSCSTPISLTQAVYYSANAQYNNAGSLQSGITWFAFTAQFTAVTFVVSGEGTGGTLVSPTVSLYPECASTSIQTINSVAGNNSTLHYEGLTTGKIYYVAVSGQNTGSFKICINNYNVPSTDGEDCETALFLDNQDDIHISTFIGAGLKKNESRGTCIGAETNSTWYRWKAANNGSLAFTLTPDETDNDLDFVVFDFGINGDCKGVNAQNAVRCAAGSGVLCDVGPKYYKTGLSFNAGDLSEEGGCGAGQNGLVKALDMEMGHNYGLLINNYSGNSGFTISFKGITGRVGTGIFDAPQAKIDYKVPDCSVNKTYIFSNYETTRKQFKWDFGMGATITDVDGMGNYTVRYDLPGTRTVSLTLRGSSGKNNETKVSFVVPVTQTPPKPVIIANQQVYCNGDIIKLHTDVVPPYSYSWTTNTGFKIAGTEIEVAVDSNYFNGEFTLVAINSNCISEITTFTPFIGIKPSAAFSVVPQFGSTVFIPATINFFNDSKKADTYLWDFGDGQTSTEVNPSHIYTVSGKFHITLTATNNTGCFNSITGGDLVVKYGNTIFIPNAFTPNADGVNDKFNVSITNINQYHLQIFSRSGALIYESKDYLTPWDGTYKGLATPGGTYYYIINATGLDGNAIKQSGSVSILR